MSALVRTREWLDADSAANVWQAGAQNAWRGWRRFAANPLGLIGLAVVLLLIGVAVLAPWLATDPPNIQNLAARLLKPSAAHWLGTDELGRDIWSRLVWGSRITLTIVAIVSVVVAPIGLAVGCTRRLCGRLGRYRADARSRTSSSPFRASFSRWPSWPRSDPAWKMRSSRSRSPHGRPSRGSPGRRRSASATATTWQPCG